MTIPHRLRTIQYRRERRKVQGSTYAEKLKRWRLAERERPKSTRGQEGKV